MSVILKAGTTDQIRAVPSVFHLRDLRHEAEAVVATARAEADRILDEAREQARDLLRQSREEGHRTGYAAGMEQGRAAGHAESLAAARRQFDEDLGQVAGTLTDMLRQVSSQRDDFLRAAEQDFLDLALRIARKVAHGVAHSHPEVARENLRQALTLVMNRTDLTIRVHPEDLQALQQFAEQQAAEFGGKAHVRVLADAAVGRGGVLLCCPEGHIDATLDQQVDQIAEALLGRME